jgi:hypothetical protein
MESVVEKNQKMFTEFRASDYRMARSMKEVYGWDAPLYVKEAEHPIWEKFCFGAAVAVLVILTLTVTL